MNVGEVSFDFEGNGYSLAEGFRLEPVANDKAIDVTMRSIERLEVSLRQEQQQLARDLSLSQIARLQKFIREYAFYNARRSGCVEFWFCAGIILQHIPGTSFQHIYAVRGALQTLFEMKSSSAQRRIIEAMRQIEMLSLGDCLLRKAAELAAVDRALHRESWFIEECSDLRQQLNRSLFYAEERRAVLPHLLQIFCQLKKIEPPSAWIVNTTDVLQHDFEEVLFENFRTGQSIDEVIQVVHSLFGDYKLIEDFCVLIRTFDPELCQKIVASLPVIHLAPTPPVVQIAGKASRKVVDHSFDSLIPEGLDVQTLASALPPLLKSIYPPDAISGEECAAIHSRLVQLNSSNQMAKFSRTELLKLAYFLEVTYKKREFTNECYFKKGHPHRIPCSVVIDKVKKVAYFLLKSRVEWIRTAGYKKVKLVLQVPPNSAESGSIVVQWVSRFFDAESIHELRAELERRFALGNPAGLWPLLFACEYVKNVEGRDLIVPTAMSPLADGNLREITTLWSFEDLVQISCLLADGLQYLHSKSQVHADIKEENILSLRRLASLLAGLNDFGLSFNTLLEKLTVSYELGYYGSILQTPPEVFGQICFRGDYFKADIWALGSVLYGLLFKQSLPWVPILLHYYNFRSQKPVPKYVNVLFYQLVRHHIEQPLKVLQESEKARMLTPLEKFTKMIYLMLSSNPEQRPTAAELQKLSREINSNV